MQMVRSEPEPFGRAVTSARARPGRTHSGLPAALPDSAAASRRRRRRCAGSHPPPIRPPTPARLPAALRHGFRPPASPGGALVFPAFSSGGRRRGGGAAARGGARAGRGGPRRRAEKNAPSSLTVSPRSPWQRRAGAGPACSGELRGERPHRGLGPRRPRGGTCGGRGGAARARGGGRRVRARPPRGVNGAWCARVCVCARQV